MCLDSSLQAVNGAICQVLLLMCLDTTCPLLLLQPHFSAFCTGPSSGCSELQGLLAAVAAIKLLHVHPPYKYHSCSHFPGGLAISN